MENQHFNEDFSFNNYLDATNLTFPSVDDSNYINDFSFSNEEFSEFIQDTLNNIDGINSTSDFLLLSELDAEKNIPDTKCKQINYCEATKEKTIHLNESSCQEDFKEFPSDSTVAKNFGFNIPHKNEVITKNEPKRYITSITFGNNCMVNKDFYNNNCTEIPYTNKNYYEKNIVNNIEKEVSIASKIDSSFDNYYQYQNSISELNSFPTMNNQTYPVYNYLPNKNLKNKGKLPEIIPEMDPVEELYCYSCTEINLENSLDCNMESNEIRNFNAENLVLFSNNYLNNNTISPTKCDINEVYLSNSDFDKKKEFLNSGNYTQLNINTSGFQYIENDLDIYFEESPTSKNARFGLSFNFLESEMNKTNAIKRVQQLFIDEKTLIKEKEKLLKISILFSSINLINVKYKPSNNKELKYNTISINNQKFSEKDIYKFLIQTNPLISTKDLDITLNDSDIILHGEIPDYDSFEDSSEEDLFNAKVNSSTNLSFESCLESYPSEDTIDPKIISCTNQNMLVGSSNQLFNNYWVPQNNTVANKTINTQYFNQIENSDNFYYNSQFEINPETNYIIETQEKKRKGIIDNSDDKQKVEKKLKSASKLSSKSIDNAPLTSSSLSIHKNTDIKTLSATNFTPNLNFDPATMTSLNLGNESLNEFSNKNNCTSQSEKTSSLNNPVHVSKKQVRCRKKIDHAFSSLDDFLDYLKKNVNESIESMVSYKFKLDANVADELPKTEFLAYNDECRTIVSNLFNEIIVGPIYEITGFRFVAIASTNFNNRYNRRFACAQDISSQRKGRSTGRRQQNAFRCQKKHDCLSSLSVTYYSFTREISVTFRHLTHSPYTDKRVTDAVKHFILSRAHMSPPQIYKELRSNSIDPELKEQAENVSQDQIRWWWTQLVKKNKKIE